MEMTRFDKEAKRLRQSFADKLKRISFEHEIMFTPMSNSEKTKVKNIISQIDNLIDSLRKDK